MDNSIEYAKERVFRAMQEPPHRQHDAINNALDDLIATAQLPIKTALKDVGYVLLTTGHPEFGIECTIADDKIDVTVTNQPDEVSAIITARRMYDAGEYELWEPLADTK